MGFLRTRFHRTRQTLYYKNRKEKNNHANHLDIKLLQRPVQRGIGFANVLSLSFYHCPPSFLFKLNLSDPLCVSFSSGRACTPS